MSDGRGFFMRWFIAAVFSIVVALVIGEIYLRVTWTPPVFSETDSHQEPLDPINTYQRVIYPTAGWRLSTSHPRIGDWGLAKDRPHADAKLNVAVTGGSVAFSMVQNNAIMRALTKRLPLNEDDINVLNYAVPAYKQPQQIYTLVEQLLSGSRIDYVINLDGFNEAVLASQNVASNASIVWPSAPMWLAELGTREAKNPTIIRLSAEILALEGRIIELQNRATCAAVVCSRILQLVASNQAQRVQSELAATQIELQQVASESATAWDIPVPPPECNQPCSDQIVDLWADASIMLGDILRGRNIRYIHVLQPNPHDVNSKPLSARESSMVEGMHRTRWPEYAARITPLQRERIPVLRERGIFVVDATRIFQGIADDRYADGCCHLNMDGNNQVADYIVSQVWTSDNAEL